MRNDQLVHEE